MKRSPSGAGGYTGVSAGPAIDWIDDNRRLCIAPRGEIGRACRNSERHHCARSEEHTSELQSPCNIVCRLLLEKKKDAREIIAVSKPNRESGSNRAYLGLILFWVGRGWRTNAADGDCSQAAVSIRILMAGDFSI